MGRALSAFTKTRNDLVVSTQSGKGSTTVHQKTMDCNMGELRELCQLPEEFCERAFAGQEDREPLFVPCED